MCCGNCCYFQNPVCFPEDETDRKKGRKEKEGREQGREGEEDETRKERTAQQSLQLCHGADRLIAAEKASRSSILSASSEPDIFVPKSG